MKALGPKGIQRAAAGTTKEKEPVAQLTRRLLAGSKEEMAQSGPLDRVNAGTQLTSELETMVAPLTL